MPDSEAAFYQEPIVPDGRTSVELLGALLSKTEIDHRILPDSSGYQLAIRGKLFEVDPVLVAGEATVWFLAAFPNKVPEGNKSLVIQVINDINSEIPFGVLYWQSGKVVFRNTIRLQTLKASSELMVFILVSMGLVDQISTKLKSVIS